MTPEMERDAAMAALLEAQAELTLAREQAERAEKAREIADNFLAPWGAWKTEWWEGLTDKPFSADVALHLIRTALAPQEKQDDR